MVVWLSTTSLRVSSVFRYKEERRTGLGQALRHPSCGDTDAVVGICQAGLFRVKISSINKYLIAILSPSLLALKNAKWSVGRQILLPHAHSNC